jgi:hypothetical protein
MTIEENVFYRTGDPALRQIAAIQTLAKWRHEERGPKWTYAGSRVLYKGSDILSWLNTQQVSPVSGRAAV